MNEILNICGGRYIRNGLMLLKLVGLLEMLLLNNSVPYTTIAIQIKVMFNRNNGTNNNPVMIS